MGAVVLQSYLPSMRNCGPSAVTNRAAGWAARKVRMTTFAEGRVGVYRYDGKGAARVDVLTAGRVKILIKKLVIMQNCNPSLILCRVYIGEGNKCYRTYLLVCIQFAKLEKCG